MWVLLLIGLAIALLVWLHLRARPVRQSRELPSAPKPIVKPISRLNLPPSTGYKPRNRPDSSPRPKVAVLGRPNKGKLLRRLAAKARRDYPGQTEAWYWRKAQEDLKRYRG
jgi:hypothetical protein